MKRDQEDIEFANLLKARTPKRAGNPWFTRKVMNRLPERSNNASRWLTIVGYAICAVLGVACWVSYLCMSDFDVIRLSDVCIFAIMVVASAFLIFAGVRSLLTRYDEF